MDYTISFMIPGLVITVVAIVVVIILVRTLSGSGINNKLLKEGVSAQATILKVWHTHVTVNDSPVVGFLVEVRPPNGQPFQAEAKMTVNLVQIPQVQPGAIVEVKYDPANPQRVAIASILIMPSQTPAMAMAGVAAGGSMGGSYAPQMDRRQAEEMLLRVNAENQAILAGGDSAPAYILRSWDQGIRVNGNNPYMSFLLEVRPDGRPPYQAEARGAISEASLHKYQPGSSILVRYDRHNPSRVSIEKSL